MHTQQSVAFSPHHLARTGAALVVLFALTSCSVFMAAKQPEKKDLSVFKHGTPRGVILAEIGAPVHSEIVDGKRVDYFTFTQGYSTAAKTGRAFFHGVADVFTLGLWEVIGTPAEAAFDGTKISVQVEYSQNDTVNVATTIKGGSLNK